MKKHLYTALAALLFVSLACPMGHAATFKQDVKNAENGLKKGAEKVETGVKHGAHKVKSVFKKDTKKVEITTKK